MLPLHNAAILCPLLRTGAIITRYFKLSSNIFQFGRILFQRRLLRLSFFGAAQSKGLPTPNANPAPRFAFGKELRQNKREVTFNKSRCERYGVRSDAVPRSCPKGRTARMTIVRVRIPPDSNKRKNLKAIANLEVSWQREKDSNPHKQSQSLSCYPYTMPLYCALS